MATHEDDPSNAGPDPQPSTRRPPGCLSRLATFVGILLLLLLAYVFAWPSPVDPFAYEPPTPPEMTGVLAENQRLRAATHIAPGEILGPEDVHVDDAGNVYGGTIDGRIMRVTPDDTLESFANTGGRPLGMEMDADGNLIVADAVKGLLSIDAEGDVTVLTTGAADVPFGFTDDLDIAGDGRIYFSDASDKFGVGEYLYDMLEARPHGRLLRYDPASGETKVLLDELYFANGIAVAADDSFVLVNETYRYRVQRYWLTGPRAGEAEVFADNLPGFPDGISRGTDGGFWVAMFTVRNAQADSLHPRPWIKSVLAKLPRFLWPKPAPYGLVLKLDTDGQIVESLHDPGGQQVREVTSVHQRGDVLYFGTLTGDRISRLELER
mgnify:CR=1 FL=1